MSIILNDDSIVSNAGNVIWYNVSEPVSIIAGDLLGIYQPPLDMSRTVIYYQNNNGPANHYIDTNNELQAYLTIHNNWY